MILRPVDILKNDGSLGEKPKIEMKYEDASLFLEWFDVVVLCVYSSFTNISVVQMKTVTA